MFIRRKSGLTTWNSSRPIPKKNLTFSTSPTYDADMILFGVAAIVAAVAAVAGAGTYFYRSSPESKPSKKRAKSHQEDYLAVLAAKVAALEASVEALPSLWKEERERAKKQADRSDQAVRDLEKRLNPEPDPEHEDAGEYPDEGQGVLPFHAGAGGDEGVQAVQNGMGRPVATPSMISQYHQKLLSRRPGA